MTTAIRTFQRHTGASWAVPDCAHDGENWYTDPARVGDVYRGAAGQLLIYCAADCPQCRRRVFGAFTARGAVRKIFKSETKETR